MEEPQREGRVKGGTEKQHKKTTKKRSGDAWVQNSTGNLPLQGREEVRSGEAQKWEAEEGP